VKSIQFHFLRGIQISDPLLMEINFSLQQGVTRRFLAEFHRNLEFQEIPVNFFEFQLTEVSLNFSLNLISNMEKFL
jgi:EAL domain-containing protein (putative c-di-GMP-specific phosphodiesterase class I)